MHAFFSSVFFGAFAGGVPFLDVRDIAYLSAAAIADSGSCWCLPGQNEGGVSSDHMRLRLNCSSWGPCGLWVGVLVPS